MADEQNRAGRDEPRPADEDDGAAERGEAVLPEDEEVEILELSGEPADPDGPDRARGLRPVEGAEAASGDAEDAEDAEVAELRREVEDLRDRSIRTLADFDNFRKRTERERRDLARYAASEAMRDLLEVSDNLERALAAGGSAEDLKTGVEMTLRQMRDALRRHGVEEVEAVGARFDPSVHEAVSRREDADAAEATVVEQLQRGYRLHDRLLRPARVVVAVPPEET